MRRQDAALVVHQCDLGILHPVGGHKPEFVEWRWEPMRNRPGLIIPFKRPVYERVVKEFSKLAGG